MELQPVRQSLESESEGQPSTQLIHSLVRMLMAVRYRLNLVLAVMAAAVLLGGLYYATAPRRYSAKAGLLITQTQPDQLDTSLTTGEALRQNTMPTFENLIRSAKVIEGALKNLAPADRVDLAGVPRERWVAQLQENISAKAIRSTSILEVSYRSKDPQVAVNVVSALVQSYLDFMDRMHRGTAGELSRILTQEREQLSQKLAEKQSELLEARRKFADMGFRSDGATLHPMVQRAVFFNDAVIAAQKKRVEQEALLISVQAAIDSGDDLGQYIMSVGDAVGREMLLSSLGLGNRDAYTQASLEKSLLDDRARLTTVQQNLGPNHPEVITLAERVRITEQYLSSAQQRINARIAGLSQSQLGPWLLSMVRQKLEESRREEQILTTQFEDARSEAINLTGQLAHLEMLDRDVKRFTEMNEVLWKQIASLDLKQNGQDVRVTETEPPVMNNKAVTPRLGVVAILAILGGGGVALGLVTLLDAMDDRFRSIDEMQSRLGLPLLTLVNRLDAPEKTGPRALVAHAFPSATASESFRTLRTALTLTQNDARQIVVTSAEPSDGKTTVLANLAVCYAQADKRTLLIDADLRRPGLTNLMDMRGPHGLSEILRSEHDLGKMAKNHIRASGIAGLDILPSGPRPSDPAELLSGPRLSQLLAWAETAYDQILIDSPPTLATADTAIIGRLVDGVVLVVQPAKNRRRLVTRVVERLNMMKIPLIGLIANRTGDDNDQGYYGYHSYGYGYEYREDYGHDDPADMTSRNGEASHEYQPDEARDDDDSRTLLVPKRVA